MLAHASVSCSWAHPFRGERGASRSHGLATCRAGPGVRSGERLALARARERAGTSRRGELSNMLARGAPGPMVRWPRARECTARRHTLRSAISGVPQSRPSTRPTTRVLHSRECGGVRSCTLAPSARRRPVLASHGSRSLRAAYSTAVSRGTGALGLTPRCRWRTADGRPVGTTRVELRATRAPREG